MATFATLSELKEQCNVEHNEDDNLLKRQLDAAESWLEKTLQQPLTEVAEKHNGQFPKILNQAILVYAATLYANREAVAFSGQPTAIPYNLMSMVTPFINFR